jgi:hypothetical protein
MLKICVLPILGWVFRIYLGWCSAENQNLFLLFMINLVKAALKNKNMKYIKVSLKDPSKEAEEQLKQLSENLEGLRASYLTNELRLRSFRLDVQLSKEKLRSIDPDNDVLSTLCDGEITVVSANSKDALHDKIVGYLCDEMLQKLLLKNYGLLSFSFGKYGSPNSLDASVIRVC